MKESLDKGSQRSVLQMSVTFVATTTLGNLAPPTPTQKLVCFQFLAYFTVKMF